MALIPIVIWSAVVVLVAGAFIASFWVKRHGESDVPNPDWAPTNEVFKDPTTNRTMRVWIDQVNQRHYVPEN